MFHNVFIIFEAALTSNYFFLFLFSYFKIPYFSCCLSTYDFNIYLVFSKVLSKLRDLLRFYIKIEKTEQIFSRVKLTVRLFQSMPQLFKSLHQNDLKHNQASITNVSKHSIFVIGLSLFKYRLVPKLKSEGTLALSHASFWSWHASFAFQIMAKQLIILSSY